MNPHRRAIWASAIVMALTATSLCAQQPRATDAGKPSRIYNTVKTKLAAGQKVVGGTIYLSDPDSYCAMANAGFDFLWIEMQHSVLTYSEVARMIAACKDAPAMPFVRIPDATEGDIQKAMDMGAIGIIIPMVDTVQKVKNAIKFASYPPRGMRSQGGGQYRAVWGNDYRQTINDNLMIVAMIENQAGVAIVDDIASIPEVDVVFTAASDLSSFTGKRQGEPEYEAYVTKVKDSVLKHGKKLAGPLAWTVRDGYSFFQGPGETQLILAGAKVELKAPATEGGKKGIAILEGTEETKNKKTN